MLAYIPGNHDAEILFSPDDAPKIGDSVNVHNKAIEVRPGLMLGGLGGSQPTLFRAEGQNDFVNVFNPYPYTTEENFAKALNDLWRDKLEPSLEGGK